MRRVSDEKPTLGKPHCSKRIVKHKSRQENKRANKVEKQMAARQLSVFTCTPSPAESPVPSPSSAVASSRVVLLLEQIKMDVAIRQQSRSHWSYNDYVQQYNTLLTNYEEEKISLMELRRFVLEVGIPDDDLQVYGNVNIRSRIWRVLLRIPSPGGASSSGSGGDDTAVVVLGYEEYLQLAQEVSFQFY